MSYVENPRVTFNRNLLRIMTEYRKRYGWGYRRVAERAGIQNKMMNDYRSGKRYPGPENVQKLAEVLGVKVEDFYRLDL